MRLILLFLVLNFVQTSWAQFPNVKWEYPIGAPAFGSAAAADMDNDGLYEIVFTTYTNDGRAHCLNAEDGSVKWIYDIGGCGDVAPIIYDANQDGTLDVIINGSCNPEIFCINGATGELIWKKASGGGDSPPTIGDIDNDGLPEVLFGNFNGEIRILNAEDGSTSKVIQAEPNFRALQTEPTLVDVNQDGQLDILAANFFNENGLFVWAYDFDGNLIWSNEQQSATADFHAYHSGALADIDNDGILEYVIGSGAGYVQAINVEDGSELWKIEVSSSNMSAITIADLDEDGVLEVIFNNNDPITFDERIWVVSGLDGQEEWSYPINFTSFRGMSVGYINDNEKLDLVSAHFMGTVRVVEPYVGLVWEMNLRQFFPSDLPWFDADHQPLIADFDQNGTVDVFVAGGYGTYEPDNQNTGSAFLIEAGVGDCPEWLMFRQNINRTGFLSQEEIAENCALVATEEITETPVSLQIIPNPAQERIELRYQLPVAGPVSIELINSLGQVVYQNGVGHQNPGTQKVSIKNTQNWRGIYWCKLKFQGQSLAVSKVIWH